MTQSSLFSAILLACQLHAVLAVTCTGINNVNACWLNATCVWENGNCRAVASQCQFRVSVEECHRNTPVGYPLCYWDGINCQTRYVYDSVRENYCHGLFNQSVYVESAKRCHDDTMCEFNIFHLQCTMNRDLVCTNLVSMQTCNLAAGCWWDDAREECHTLARDYLYDCSDYSSSNCPVSECYVAVVAGGLRCIAKRKIDSYPFPYISAFCSINSYNPFDLVRFNVSRSDCLLNRHPWCNVSTSSTAPQSCVPAKNFTCNYISTREECDQYSFCTYSWRCYPLGDSEPSPPSYALQRFSPFDRHSTNFGADASAVWIVYFVSVLSVWSLGGNVFTMTPSKKTE
jgi:hypothetical protein